MNVTPVAHASATSTKNCQGWRRWSAGLVRPPEGRSVSPASVEVAELIVEAFVQLRILRGGRFVRLRIATLGQPHGREPDGDRAAGADHVGEQPRQAVE